MVCCWAANFWPVLPVPGSTAAFIGASPMKLFKPKHRACSPRPQGLSLEKSERLADAGLPVFHAMSSARVRMTTPETDVVLTNSSYGGPAAERAEGGLLRSDFLRV